MSSSKSIDPTSDLETEFGLDMGLSFVKTTCDITFVKSTFDHSALERGTISWLRGDFKSSSLAVTTVSNFAGSLDKRLDSPVNCVAMPTALLIAPS